jgi:hypothetical protein
MNDTVSIKYVVDTTEIDAKIPKVTDAIKGLDDALVGANKPLDKLGETAKDTGKKAEDAGKDIDKTTKATKATGDAADKSAKSHKNLGDSMGKVGSSAKKLNGVVGELAGVVGTNLVGALDDMGDVGEVSGAVMEGLGLSAGVTSLAIAALAEVALAAYVGYKVYNEESDRAATISGYVAAAETARIPILASLNASITNLKLATGELSAEEAKLLDISNKAFDAVTKATAAQRAQISQLEAAQNSVTTQMIDAAESIIPAWTPLGKVIDGLTTDTGEYAMQIIALNDEVTKTISITDKYVENEKKAVSVANDRAAGAQALTEWLAKTNALMAEESALAIANANQFAATSDAFQKAEEDALNAIIKRRDGELGAINIATRAQADALKKQFETEYTALKGNYSARETLAVDYEAAVTAIEASAQEQREAIMAANDAKKAEQRAADLADAKKATDEQAAYEKKAAEETLVARRELATSSLDLANNYVTGVIGAATDLAEALGASEKKVFAIRKAAAMASATILAAQAILVALATPPPLTVPAIALAVVAGGLQVATIAASKPPSMRSGGIVGGDIGAYAAAAPASMPDAMPVSAERGEAILTRQGVSTFGGEQGVRDGNAGVSPIPSSVALQLGHRTMQEVIVDQLRRPSSMRYATVGPMPSTTNIYQAAQ